MDSTSIPTGVVVLAGIALVVSGLCHWRIRRFWPASLLTAVASPILFFMAALIQEGHAPAPLSLQAFALFAGFALLIGLVVGLLAIVMRRLLPVGA